MPTLRVIVNRGFTIVAQVDLVPALRAPQIGRMDRDQPTKRQPLPVTDDHAVATTPDDGAAVVRELRDRVEDRDLFASAFTADAELDFGPAAAKWGANPPPMSGRDAIVTTVLGLFAGRVDTTHQVTNPRVAVDGDTARLTALVEAQHLLTADHDVFALLKNPYDVELTRDGARWLIRRVRIDNAWFTGDPAAIFPA
jgi:hypothetical protein